MKEIYFVSYGITLPSGSNVGFGNAELDCSRPITHMSQVQELTAQIQEEAAKRLGVECKIMILNYQLLRTERRQAA